MGVCSLWLDLNLADCGLLDVLVREAMWLAGLVKAFCLKEDALSGLGCEGAMTEMSGCEQAD